MGLSEFDSTYVQARCCLRHPVLMRPPQRRLLLLDLSKAPKECAIPSAALQEPRLTVHALFRSLVCFPRVWWRRSVALSPCSVRFPRHDSLLSLADLSTSSGYGTVSEPLFLSCAVRLCADPASRLAEDIANAAVFLFSPAASYITGTDRRAHV
mgnify:FL=1